MRNSLDYAGLAQLCARSPIMRKIMHAHNRIIQPSLGAGMVVCLERGADLHMAQLMPLPLAVSCFSKIQIGFTFLVPANPGSPGKRAIKRVCVGVWVCIFLARHKTQHFL